MKTIPLPKGYLDITGDKYGKLTVLSFAGRVNGASMWKCRCRCGHVGNYCLGNLRGGHTSKCINCRPKKHGQSKTRLYYLWIMYKKADILCRKWRDFNKFSADVTDHPRQFFSRYNLSKPHSPSNSYWGDRKQHSTHPRGTHGRFYSFDGLTLNLSQWGERLSISKERVRQLVDKHGTIEAAIKHRANRRGVTIAKVIESFPEHVDEGLSYLEQYNDGNIWQLKMEDDFPGKSINNIRLDCYRYAKINNLAYKTRIFDDTIFVQFKPISDER